ncbi:hypothetical protein MKW94_020225 [Papaver nudicaule]|uniref:Uncharacterized protein n=1 Tax=Papaver nudicaule TaxID=74823 RepID=A0AA41VQB8_PAPNU|nr:hypothetical protein [Papaver nudicaule]
MNRILRSSVCRSSLSRRNSFTRWSSKPISSSSSLVSNNPTSSNLITVPISKFYHTVFSTPGHHFRKEAAAPPAECNFDHGDLEKEISEIHEAVIYARHSIESGTGSPLVAVKIPKDKCNALMEKLGLDEYARGYYNPPPYPSHLFKFHYKIESLKLRVYEIVDFGEYVAAIAAGRYCGAPCWDEFNSSRDYVENEIWEVRAACMTACSSIEEGYLPPLDAVKTPVDKFNALMEKVQMGHDTEKYGDYPPHLKKFRSEILRAEESVYRIKTFGKYVADGNPPDYLKFKDWLVGRYDHSDTLPTAQDK